MKETKARHKKLSIFLVLTGVVFILYLFFGISMNWGVYFGCTIIALAGSLMVLYGFINLSGIRLPQDKLIKILSTLFKSALGIFIASFIIIEGLIIVYETPDKAAVDYVLIEGAALKGETPSLDLKERLDKALSYLKSFPAVKVIVSGGQGSGEAITEAEAMKRYLVNHGIKEDRVIKEDKSTSTFENLLFSRYIIQRYDKRRPIKLMIVTNDFHIFRSKLLARRLGYEAYGLPAPTPFYIIPNHYVREYFAVIKSVIVDRP